MSRVATEPTGVESILPELLHRHKRVRSGLVVGFGGDGVVEHFRSHRPGVWMEADAGELPFEDSQFEVVVVAKSAVSRDMVREINRVMVSGGSLFFSVDEKTHSQDGYTAPEIYKLVREGFDILALRRPPWWTFGKRGHVITVCARKKAWREHKGFRRDGTYLFTPFRSRTNHGELGVGS